MEVLQDDLTCSICLELFTDPRILPCGHNLCSSCLELLSSHISRNAGGHGVACPTCRAQVRGASLNVLPRNHILESIVKHFKASLSQTNTAPRCTGFSFLNDVTLSYCQLHPTKMCELYCQPCAVTVCTACAETQHTGFQHVIANFKQYRSRKIKSDNLNALWEQLQQQERVIKKDTEKIEQHTAYIQSHEDTLLQQLDGLMQPLTQFLTSAQTLLKWQLHMHLETIRQPLSDASERMSVKKEELRVLREQRKKMVLDSYADSDLGLRKVKKWELDAENILHRPSASTDIEISNHVELPFWSVNTVPVMHAIQALQWTIAGGAAARTTHMNRPSLTGHNNATGPVAGMISKSTSATQTDSPNSTGFDADLNKNCAQKAELRQANPASTSTNINTATTRITSNPVSSFNFTNGIIPPLFQSPLSHCEGTGSDVNHNGRRRSFFKSLIAENADAPTDSSHAPVAAVSNHRDVDSNRTPLDAPSSDPVALSEPGANAAPTLDCPSQLYNNTQASSNGTDAVEHKEIDRTYDLAIDNLQLPMMSGDSSKHLPLAGTEKDQPTSLSSNSSMLSDSAYGDAASNNNNIDSTVETNIPDIADTPGDSNSTYPLAATPVSEASNKVMKIIGQFEKHSIARDQSDVLTAGSNTKVYSPSVSKIHQSFLPPAQPATISNTPQSDNKSGSYTCRSSVYSPTCAQGSPKVLAQKSVQNTTVTLSEIPGAALIPTAPPLPGVNSCSVPYSATLSPHRINPVSTDSALIPTAPALSEVNGRSVSDSSKQATQKFNTPSDKALSEMNAAVIPIPPPLPMLNTPRGPYSASQSVHNGHSQADKPRSTTTANIAVIPIAPSLPVTIFPSVSHQNGHPSVNSTRGSRRSRVAGNVLSHSRNHVDTSSQSQLHRTPADHSLSSNSAAAAGHAVSNSIDRNITNNASSSIGKNGATVVPNVYPIISSYFNHESEVNPDPNVPLVIESYQKDKKLKHHTKGLMENGISDVHVNDVHDVEKHTDNSDQKNSPMPNKCESVAVKVGASIKRGERTPAFDLEAVDDRLIEPMPKTSTPESKTSKARTCNDHSQNDNVAVSQANEASSTRPTNNCNELVKDMTESLNKHFLNKLSKANHSSKTKAMFTTFVCNRSDGKVLKPLLSDNTSLDTVDSSNKMAESSVNVGQYSRKPVDVIDGETNLSMSSSNNSNMFKWEYCPERFSSTFTVRDKSLVNGIDNASVSSRTFVFGDLSGLSTNGNAASDLASGTDVIGAPLFKMQNTPTQRSSKEMQRIKERQRSKNRMKVKNLGENKFFSSLPPTPPLEDAYDEEHVIKYVKSA